MEEKKQTENVIPSTDDYQYGFHDEDTSVYNTGRGLTEEIVREISRIKEEPEWMLEYRLDAYRKFMAMPMPKWGPDLSFIDFDEYIYYIKPSDRKQSRQS